MRANPHCGRVYKEKFRARKKLAAVFRFSFSILANLKYDSLDNTAGT
jgi:hypothetical protein